MIAHILADPAAHQAASNAWTAYDTKSAEQAGIFAGAVVGGIVLLKSIFGGSRRAATSR